MKSFFKIFLASLLSLIVFALLGVFVLSGVIAAFSNNEKEAITKRSILLVDLSKQFNEVSDENPLAAFSDGEDIEQPSSYDAVRLIQKAASDPNIAGIYIKCSSNANGFGTSATLRGALHEFKKTKKFILSYANVITQSSYQVANVADKVYVNPQGGLDWHGFSMNYFFLKGALDRLEIEPQIFYAGKFKSATEPFRVDKMTEPNRIQTTELLQDLYTTFLQQTADVRHIDVTTLRQYATAHRIQMPQDAVATKLIDGLRYEDEVMGEMKQRMGVAKDEAVPLITLARYAKAVDFKQFGKDKIGVIYAEGDIIDGKGDRDRIGSDSYVALIRKLHQDKAIKAIVVRINSGGGSAMASENIWRALTLAKKDKPIIVSFGDVAASGGYYLACNADSIFAHPNTITGSIGVFSILPNMQQFFDHKLGVTFDGVMTGENAESMGVTKALTPSQKQWMQAGVDSIYYTFTSRVAEGRKMTRAQVDSIGQGRVWSGMRALQLGLVDRLGGLQDAIACAARMANIDNFRLREYPEPQSIFEKLMGTYQQQAAISILKQELGTDQYKMLQSVQRIKAMAGITQTRMPWDFVIE